jgi:SAM-dependent methyltransferase
MQMAWGYGPTLVVDAAVRLGLFDLLDSGPKSLHEVSAATGASERGLRAVLNALVGLALLQVSAETYELTSESAAYLVSAKPGYRGPFFRHHTQQLLPQWMELEAIVRSGRPVRQTNRQADGAQHFVAFVGSLFPGGYPAAVALGEHLGVSRSAQQLSVLDLGAGSGVWGIALALQSAQVRVCAVDWPAVLEITRTVAARHGVTSQLTCVEGDLFEVDFRSGHAVAILGHILHSEGPDRVAQLLRKTCAALAPGGTVAIQEFVPDNDRRGPLMPLLFAVNMLVNTEAGNTYTFDEISRWLAEAGFVDARQLPVPAVSPLILATKPK